MIIINLKGGLEIKCFNMPWAMFWPKKKLYLLCDIRLQEFIKKTHHQEMFQEKLI